MVLLEEQLAGLQQRLAALEDSATQAGETLSQRESELSHKDAQIEELTAQAQRLERENAQLVHAYELLLRRLSGPSRERFDPNQLTLFEGDAPAESDAGEESSVDEDGQPSPSTKRRGHGRRTLPADLPRKRIEYELSDEERGCPCCGCQRKKIGEEVSEQLELVPSTVVPVLDPTLPHAKKGRFWAYIGDASHPYSVYDYTDSRKRDGPQNFLEGYSGYLQADAYAGYDCVYAGEQVLECGCRAHTRRKFFEAQSTSPKESAHALATIRRLYMVEREAKPLSAKERQQMRHEQSRPVLQTVDTWLQEQQATQLPKSPIMTAVNYTRNQWEALNRYLDDGDLSIDNNESERTVRAQAIGRKNWMFAGSDTGGATAAVLYSLIATCQRHTIEPWAYLPDVLTRLPSLPEEEFADLRPDLWLSGQPDARIARPS